jgi:anhydro-N-acetylmuramic acid kinase
MSGTSMDAIDAALVEFDDEQVRVRAYKQFPIPVNIQTRVRSVNDATPIKEVSELDTILGRIFADASNRLIEFSGINRTDILAIGSHGQTVLHLPEGEFARTLQIGDANVIANETGITTIADFRRMDIAAGGQGAPLASAFHDYQFRQSTKNRVILNIGGMANVTFLPSDPDEKVIGFDSGPGNALMDDWTQKHLQHDFDEDGNWAKSGNFDEHLLGDMLRSSYFHAKPPKSTGKDDFNLTWLAQKLSERDEPISAEDVQATLLELSAVSISESIRSFAETSEEILICGGGVHNKQLIHRLKAILQDIEIRSTAELGVDPDALEAIIFAWLAKCRMENIPANVPSVTGAGKKVLLGGVYKPL